MADRAPGEHSPTEELVAALAGVAEAPRLLVASDFDGVLAPFVMDPADARPQPGTVESLRDLAGLGDTWVAVVSGRDLATLDRLTGLADSPVVRIGSHGAETSRDDSALLTPDAADRLAGLREFVTGAVAERDPRIRLEDKPAAIVLHTRGLPAEAVDTAAGIAEDAARTDGVGLLTGKAVHELSVLEADKGSALRRLADEVGADATVYIGDDVTDEHVFAVLGRDDLGLKVGPGETAARGRLEACTDVPGLLARLAELRSAPPR